MDLKELIKKVELLKKEMDTCDTRTSSGEGRHQMICLQLDCISQTVGAVDEFIERRQPYNKQLDEDWQKLKKLLGGKQ